MTNSSRIEPDLGFGNLESGQPIASIIDCICESMHTDKIYLLGTYPANPEILGLEYDLLVLIHSEDKRPMHVFESLISNRCHDLAMVTVSVYKTEVIKQLLLKGNIFFSALCKKEKLVFDGIDIPLINERFNDITISVEELEKEFSCQFSRARSFLSGAVSYRITGDNQLSAFMLHQTVEQGLNAFLTPLMGYRMQTHNLNKLFVNARRFSIGFYKIFPRNTDTEIQLYQTLHQAYIYGRYKNNFQVGVEKLQILIERTTALLELVESTFFEKTAHYRSEIAGL